MSPRMRDFRRWLYLWAGGVTMLLLAALGIAIYLALSGQPGQSPVRPAPQMKSAPRRGGAGPSAIKAPSPGPTIPPGAAPSSSSTIQMPDDSFSPANITVAAGTLITWFNNSGVPHSVTSDSSNLGGPNSDGRYPNGIPSGSKYTWRVPAHARPGETWYYYCRFHGNPGHGMNEGSGMVGAITVK